MDFKIFSINEWQESDNYTLNEWYMEKKYFIEKLFDENEVYKDLSFTKFSHDNTRIGDVRFGYVFFDDNNIDYKLEIIIDFKKITNDYTNDNVFVIDEAEYILYGNYINSDEKLKSIKSTITDEEITDDFIITLISEFSEINKLND